MMNIYDAVQMFRKNRQMYCSVDTVQYYDENLSRFLLWLESVLGSSDIMIENLPSDVMQDYIIYLRGTKVKNVTIRTYCRAVKVFLGWAYGERLCENYVNGVRYPRDDSGIVTPLYADEVVVLDSGFNDTTVLGIRDFCIIHLMLDCGLRLGEVVSLRCQDVLFNKNIICVVDSKYNKSRLVPLPSFLASTLQNYISLVQPSQEILLTRRGCPLNENTIKLLFSRLKRFSGIPRIHAHLLRHSFATSYIYYGGNLEMLRLLLGHSDYNVTRGYLHLANQYTLMDAELYRLDDIFYRDRRLIH